MNSCNTDIFSATTIIGSLSALNIRITYLIHLLKHLAFSRYVPKKSVFRESDAK